MSENDEKIGFWAFFWEYFFSTKNPSVRIKQKDAGDPGRVNLSKSTEKKCNKNQ